MKKFINANLILAFLLSSLIISSINAGAGGPTLTDRPKLNTLSEALLYNIDINTLSSETQSSLKKELDLNYVGGNPLFSAIQSQYQNNIKWILENGGTKFLGIQKELGYCALHIAYESATVKLLLAHSADPTLITTSCPLRCVGSHCYRHVGLTPLEVITSQSALSLYQERRNSYKQTLDSKPSLSPEEILLMVLDLRYSAKILRNLENRNKHALTCVHKPAYPLPDISNYEVVDESPTNRDSEFFASPSLYRAIDNEINLYKISPVIQAEFAAEITDTTALNKAIQSEYKPNIKWAAEHTPLKMLQNPACGYSALHLTHDPKTVLILLKAKASVKPSTKCDCPSKDLCITHVGVTPSQTLYLKKRDIYQELKVGGFSKHTKEHKITDIKNIEESIMILEKAEAEDKIATWLSKAYRAKHPRSATP